MTVWDTVREVEAERRERNQSSSDHTRTGWLTSLVTGALLAAATAPTTISYDTDTTPSNTYAELPGSTPDTVRVIEDSVRFKHDTVHVVKPRPDQDLVRRADSLEARLHEANTSRAANHDDNHAEPYREPRQRNAYRDEHIPILMYHKVGRPEDRYTVSASRLENQLERLHDNNFYCVSLGDYIEADFDHVPQGKKPIVLTFDDAAPSQFQYDASGEPSDKSAVGILEDVFDEHEDFGGKATFYVSYAGDDHRFRHPFGGREEDKLAYLQDNGYTVGYHTPFHTDNETASPHDIDKQTTILHALIRDNDAEPAHRHYAHPFGATPDNQRASQALEDEYTSIVEAWGGFAPHPGSPQFDPHSIPRIETNAETFETVLRRDAYVKGEARNP